MEEVQVWLGSWIGAPVDEPALSSIQLLLSAGVEMEDVEDKAQEILEGRLGGIGQFISRAVQGEFPVC